MTWDTDVLVVGLAAVAAFAAACHFCGLVVRVRDVVAPMRKAMAVLTDKTLADAAKEHVLRRIALRLFKHAAQIALTSVLVLTAPGVVLWLGDALGFAPLADTWIMLSSIEFIVAGSAMLLAVVWLARRQ